MPVHDITYTAKMNEIADIKRSEMRNEKSEIIFDLMGRRVENATKGIYIVNGKRVLIN